MISSLNRKLRERRNQHARKPLIALLRSCAAHVMVPWSGLEIEAWTLMQCQAAIGQALRDLADRGAFRYFEISDGRQLGSPPISVFVLDDGLPPYGKVDVVVEPLVAWIFLGGRGGQGWRDPRGISAADLA